MLAEAIEIYRSLQRADCEERAFMLTAVGVPNEVSLYDGVFGLWVQPENLELARTHLTRYQLEMRTAAPRRPPPAPLHAWAWLGSALYALVLLGVAAAVSQGVGRLDDFEAGELNGAQVQHGQWWRAWTALTLHLDAAHIVANLGAGIWFGYLAGRLLGPGIAWALIVLGAGIANLSEALLAAPAYRAVGASTAVFTTLGMVAAYSWRERYRLSQRWAARAGPLIAGVIMLGWLGTAGEHTDIMAHLTGFIVGTVLGALLAPAAVRLLGGRAGQLLTGAFALIIVCAAWTCALLS